MARTLAGHSNGSLGRQLPTVQPHNRAAAPCPYHIGYARAIAGVVLCLATSCSVLRGAQGTGGMPGSVMLMAPAPDASATPTPFQPPAGEQLLPGSVYSIQVPTLEPFFPTASPAPGFRPTVDLNSLFPTAAAPPVMPDSGEAPLPFPSLSSPDTLNFLLVGSDKRPGGTFRTDTLVLVILWPRQGQASMISIPRDLWTYIPGVGMQRVNTAYESGEIDGYSGGGAGLLRDTIAYNLGIRVDHTAMVEFDGFSRIVNTLGGVDVPVACPYTDWHLVDPTADPEQESSWSLYTVEPGTVHMDGDLALWYARSRLESNDFDRGRRQQEVLRSIFDKALTTNTLGRIPQLYKDFSNSVLTDLSLGDIVKLALYAPSLSNPSIRSYFIRPPAVTEWTTPAGADVLLPVQDQLEQLLIRATTLSDTATHRQAISVEVQNGTPVAGTDGLAASRLNYAGYATHVSPADSQDHQNSVLYDATSSQDPSARTALLDVLGLDSASVVSEPNSGAAYQYRLVLGADYQACFQPEDLEH